MYMTCVGSSSHPQQHRYILSSKLLVSVLCLGILSDPKDALGMKQTMQICVRQSQRRALAGWLCLETSALSEADFLSGRFC